MPFLLIYFCETVNNIKHTFNSRVYLVSMTIIMLIWENPTWFYEMFVHSRFAVLLAKNFENGPKVINWCFFFLLFVHFYESNFYRNFRWYTCILTYRFIEMTNKITQFHVVFNKIKNICRMQCSKWRRRYKERQTQKDFNSGFVTLLILDGVNDLCASSLHVSINTQSFFSFVSCITEFHTLFFVGFISSRFKWKKNPRILKT